MLQLREYFKKPQDTQPSLRHYRQFQPAGVPTRQLIQREAKLGGLLFGEVPPTRQRLFFCLDATTWVWYESWSDEQGDHEVTTRYELHGSYVLKLQDGCSSELIEGAELENLLQAAEAYLAVVAKEIYGELRSLPNTFSC